MRLHKKKLNVMISILLVSVCLLNFIIVGIVLGPSEAYATSTPCTDGLKACLKYGGGEACWAGWCACMESLYGGSPDFCELYQQ